MLPAVGTTVMLSLLLPTWPATLMITVRMLTPGLHAWLQTLTPTAETASVTGSTPRLAPPALTPTDLKQYRWRILNEFIV